MQVFRCHTQVKADRTYARAKALHKELAVVAIDAIGTSSDCFPHFFEIVQLESMPTFGHIAVTSAINGLT